MFMEMRALNRSEGPANRGEEYGLAQAWPFCVKQSVPSPLIKALTVASALLLARRLGLLFVLF